MAGLFVPVTGLRSLSSAVVTSGFAWVTLVAILLLVVALLLLRARRSAVRRALVTLSSLSLLGSLVADVRLLALAVEQEATIDVPTLLVGDTASAEGNAPDETLPYTSYDGEDVTLSLWLPAGQGTGDQAAPVLFMTHGGGWTSGGVTYPDRAAHARWFADQGYLVIGADYSLSTPQRHLWQVQEPQLACALAWSAQHAAEYGGDIDRLAAYGDSAGGNLVLNVTYRAAAGDLTTECGEIPTVHAVSAAYPGVSPHDIWNASDPIGQAVAREFLTQHAGGSPEQEPAAYAALDSAATVTAAAPPTLVTVAERDILVEPPSVEAFLRVADEAGVQSELITVPLADHAFDADTGSLGSQVWRQATLRWFVEHGV